MALAALAIVAFVTLYNEILRGEDPTGFGVILLIVNGGSLAFRRLWR